MIKSILVATDGSSHAEKAVAMASEIAAKLGARVALVHSMLYGTPSATLRKLADRKVLSKAQRDLLDNYEADVQMAMAQSGMPALGAVPAPAELLQPIGRQILDRAAAAVKKAGVKKVTTHLVGDDATDSILDAAKREKADMIVLGTRGLGDIKGLLLGSVSHKISARAGCAVLTVK